MNPLLPTALDEYPIHQAPLPIARADTTDKNFYDRCYFNAFPHTGSGAGETMVISGAGVYPHLGVQDAFLVVRCGDRQTAARFSTSLDGRTIGHRITGADGRYEVEVLDPLEGLRITCEAPGIAADLSWSGAFPAVLEQPHLMLGPTRPTLLAQRFAQVGSWSGTVQVDGEDVAVRPEEWGGTRDRSWGIRPVGDADPTGRDADLAADGFWWLYCPLHFDDFALVVILQETPQGYRTLNDAVRVFPDGRVEQLGWPRIDLDYRSGSRHPLAARLRLTDASGCDLELEVTTATGVALHIGCGYGGDSEWLHGQWRGEGWVQVSSYDLGADDVAGRIPWGVSDHAARAVLRTPGEPDREGWGLFEHASIGRHDPTGFSDWMAVAP